MDPSVPPEKKSRKKRRNGDDGNGHHEPADERLRELLGALEAAQNGDFAVRLPFSRGTGVMSDIARAFNSVVSRNEALSTEIVRLERVVGREGRMTGRPAVGGVRGGWGTSFNSINSLTAALDHPATEVPRVLIAV